MDSLRKQDDKIRSVVLGEKLGEAVKDFDFEITDPVSMKDLLKSSKSKIARREFMAAIADLGRFHNKFMHAAQQIEVLDKDVDAIHHQFLFKELKDKEKEHLLALKNRLGAQQAILTKEAGYIGDFLANMSQRGRALAAWEKMYPKKVGELRNKTQELQNMSEDRLGQIISILKDLAVFRSKRDIDNYVKKGGELKKLYGAYDKFFKNYYTTIAQPLLQQMPKEEEGIPPTVNDPSAQGPVTSPAGPAGVALTPAVISPAVPSVAIPAGQQQHLQTVTPPPGSKTPVVPQGPMSSGNPSIPPGEMGSKVDPETAALYKAVQAGLPKNVLTSQQFVEVLESLSGQDPLVLASVIAKYARNIESSDPASAIQLFKIAKNIRG